MVEHLRNNTKTWMFGTTSALSKEIIKNLDNPVCFGRHNVDYSDPDKFIKEHVVDNTPVNICVNVFIDTKCRVIRTLEEFKEAHDRFAPTIFFFYKLLTMTTSLKKPVKVCYITSTFPNSYIARPNEEIIKTDAEIDEGVFMYGSARAMQQFAYISRHNEFCRSIGVSPSRITKENISEYGKTIAELLYKDNDDVQWESVYDLYSKCWFRNQHLLGK